MVGRNLDNDIDNENIQYWELSAPPDAKTDENLRTAGAIFASTVAVLCGLTAPFVFTRSVLPYMATPKNKVRRALSYLRDRHADKKVFVDLGSGDGEAVKQAAGLGYRAIGIELNFSLWAFSSMRRQFFFTPEERARSQILWANMFSYHLQRDFNADTVMIFGVTPLMRTISQKLQHECSPGTHILSYRFGIPTKSPDEPEHLDGRVVYNEQEMRIYEKAHKSSDFADSNCSSPDRMSINDYHS